MSFRDFNFLEVRMNRVNRSLLVLAVAGGLCGGISFVQAGGPIQRAQQLDEHHYKYEHMHNALHLLHDARQELEQAEDIFAGHRKDALDHVDQAIKHIQDGLKEQHDEEAALPSALPAVINLDEKYPHMRKSLDLLHQAYDELDKADHIFQGHREDAMDHCNKAIKQVEDGIKDATK
jgi:tetratricopeptide (TPR) repeat protein